MKYFSSIIPICTLALFLSSCKQEVVAPEQQITGRYALDDGSGTTDTYLEFSKGRLSFYISNSLYPLAENMIWDCDEDKFEQVSSSNYSITDGVLVSSRGNFGKVELSNGKLHVGADIYNELKGFTSEHYSVIHPSKDRLDLTYAAETVELAVNVENALPAWSLRAETKVPWIFGLKVENNILKFKTRSTATDRTGVIELKYPHAETVALSVSQKPSTFIKPSSESLTFGYEASSQTLGYTIENPISGSSLSATSDASWISDIQVSETQISFKLGENNSAATRSSFLTLSYDGAPDVLVYVNQKGMLVTSLSLNRTDLVLYPGRSEKLNAIVVPSDANLIWVSSNTSVATVSSDGTVTANGNGTATITVSATDGSGKNAKCTVTVTTPVSSITLNKATLSLFVGNEATLSVTILPNNATDKSYTWSSSDSSIASVDNNGKVTARANGNATIKATANDGSGVFASCSVIVFAEKVDMEIKTSDGKTLYWSTRNLCKSGFVNSPVDYGDYYAWGETAPKENYSWSTYLFGKSPSGRFSKYNTSSSYGNVDNKTVLDPEDDVASVKLGGKWRMPTDAEWTELRTKCTWTWTTNYNGTGVKGQIVTATNGNSIFLPAAGSRGGTSLGTVGSGGGYWSSSLYTDIPYIAWCVGFYSGGVDRRYYYRYYGYSIRPVTE